jgi:hypothetical protein
VAGDHITGSMGSRHSLMRKVRPTHLILDVADRQQFWNYHSSKSPPLLTLCTSADEQYRTPLKHPILPSEPHDSKTDSTNIMCSSTVR